VLDAAKQIKDISPFISQSLRIKPTAPLLFWYSAVMFSDHKIYFIMSYATKTNGYLRPIILAPVQGKLLCRMVTNMYNQTLKINWFCLLSLVFSRRLFCAEC
jgi:hydroxyacyl-ACP dehydratase HTD2-like protein with hotdog domain